MIIHTSIYNEMPWVPFFLEHLLEFDCRIVIGEGASDVVQFENERSSDGSLEIINAFVDKWNDRVTLIPHKYTGSSKSREDVKMYVWSCLEFDEWMFGLAPDNFYIPEDISRLKKICNEKNNGIYTLLTGMKVFAFNFHTIVTKPNVKGLTKGWYRLWPCIWRKNYEYIQTVGDELLRQASHRARKLVTFRVQNSGLPKGVLLREDITNFHYKAVKHRYTREKRFGEEDADAFSKHSLTASYLKKYNGEHHPILDNHPWRYVKDCRRQNDKVNWR